MDPLAAHLARLGALVDGKHTALIEISIRLASTELAPLARLGLDRTSIEILVAVAAPALDVALARRLRETWADAAPTIEELITLLAVGPTTPEALFAALSPDAPLVARGLVDLVGTELSPLSRTVRVDERVIGHLHGSTAIDRRLRTAASHHRAAPPTVDAASATRIARALATQGPIVVEGPALAGKTAAVIAAAALTHRTSLVVDLEMIATSDAPVAQLARARREAMLLDAQLVLRARSWSETWPAALRRDAIALVQDRGAVLTVRDAAEPGRQLSGARRISIAMPATSVQREIWRAQLGDDAVELDVVDRYPLPPGDIVLAASSARVAAELDDRPILSTDLIVAARDRVCHRMGEVAELATTSLGWDDVVLPRDVVSQLQELVGSVRHRDRVMNGWGFAQKLPYGRSTSALFSGPPGTGKTMVATLIGNELGLEVFRIDLSKVVSKFIGETEKNLGRVFEEAARCRAILLFDEADSLFAKRTEVKGSNDRYANLEVNYLLQRLEAHDGIVILTTNAATSIDPAFLRRLRYRIEFPAPEEAERAELWRSMVPDGAPLADGLDFEGVARRYPLSGGHIKNALVRAAFLAANDEQGALTQAVLDRAAALEWMELGRLPGGSATAPVVVEPPAPLARGSSLEIRRISLAPPPAVAIPNERTMLAILASGPERGETIDAAFRRKERDLGAAMAALSVAEARALHRRLTTAPQATDALALQFARLAADRRQRLLAFLSDARRREALTSSRAAAAT